MITIAQPYCDWIYVANKDKRKAKMWLCKACGHTGKARDVPECPCQPISIGRPMISIP